MKQHLEREIIDETESSDDDDDATDTAQEEEEEEEQEEYVDMQNEDFVKDTDYPEKVEPRHSLDDPTENELDDLLDDTEDSETEDSQIHDIVDGEPTVSSEIKLNHLNSDDTDNNNVPSNTVEINNHLTQHRNIPGNVNKDYNSFESGLIGVCGKDKVSTVIDILLDNSITVNMTKETYVNSSEPY